MGASDDSLQLVQPMIVFDRTISRMVPEFGCSIPSVRSPAVGSAGQDAEPPPAHSCEATGRFFGG